MWLKEFSDANDVTWRILRTYPSSGKINIFKIALRCQHFTDRRAKHVRTTKNTNCPAELSLTVRRYAKYCCLINKYNVVEYYILKVLLFKCNTSYSYKGI